MCDDGQILSVLMWEGFRTQLDRNNSLDSRFREESTQGKVGSMMSLHYLMKGNLYHTPGEAKALLEHICTSLHGLLATYGAIWAHGECIPALPRQLGLGFYGCPAERCKMVLTWYCAPQLQKPPLDFKGYRNSSLCSNRVCFLWVPLPN